jgi:hypothetical protein
VGANEIVAPYWGFFSTGHFAGHERKFGQDFKDIFSELYREFEVRQQVSDITVENVSDSFAPSLPSVSDGSCGS